MAHPADEIVGALPNATEEDRTVIRHAYEVAERVHKGELRKSGDPYISHPRAIALSLARLGMDRDTVIAGILHDTIEDTPYTPEELEKEFGATVRFLVESVTKLSKLKYQGLARHVESLRRLLVATAADVRVIIIKLADRLHNMQTLQYVETRKQPRIAEETMEIYVPIAERLGMGAIKTELQDLAFKMLDPKGFAEAEREMHKISKEHDEDLAEAVKETKKALAEAGITAFRTETRVKSVSSFVTKLKRKRGDLGKIYDLFALRIIVPTLGDCYRVMGVVHNIWRPVPGRVKDYIAYPKPNGYQSIHTAVVTARGLTIEVQIRTEKMHQESQYGVAAHFRYKGGGADSLPHLMQLKTASAPQWLKELSDALSDTETEDFKEALQQDFFAERIFAFTPKGDAIDLPVGATPIDFAYAVHSDLGDGAQGALVNGKLVQLDTPLKNGDRVEVKVKKDGKPNRKWLEFVKTAGARKHIRSALAQKKT